MIMHSICINKFDINPGMSEKIKSYAEKNNIEYVGSIPYDRNVTATMVTQQSLVDFSNGKGAEAIKKKVWKKVKAFMT